MRRSQRNNADSFTHISAVSLYSIFFALRSLPFFLYQFFNLPPQRPTYTQLTFSLPLSLFSVSCAQCYKRILQIDPTNIQGLHNLCVVYVERGKLTQALDCLQQAHKLAPEEDYILRHLKIVQQRIANLRQAASRSASKSKKLPFESTDFDGSRETSGDDGSPADTPKSTTNGNDAHHGPHSIDASDDKRKTSESDVSRYKKYVNDDKHQTDNGQPKRTENQNLPDDSTISKKRNSINDNAADVGDDYDGDLGRDGAEMPSSGDSDRAAASTTAQTPMHTNFQRHHQQQQSTANEDGPVDALPSFVHDLDDPSSGTS